MQRSSDPGNKSDNIHYSESEKKLKDKMNAY